MPGPWASISTSSTGRMPRPCVHCRCGGFSAMAVGNGQHISDQVRKISFSFYKIININHVFMKRSHGFPDGCRKLELGLAHSPAPLSQRHGDRQKSRQSRVLLALDGVCRCDAKAGEQSQNLRDCRCPYVQRQQWLGSVGRFPISGGRGARLAWRLAAGWGGGANRSPPPPPEHQGRRQGHHAGRQRSLV